jgi:S-adenosylmethionine hydrolase
MSNIITLTTDFGTRDGYVAAMKGVILGIVPGVDLVDISHEVAPQDIHEAAYLVAGVYRFFPPQTVHLVVVDPGVGTERRGLALRVGAHRFVAPDNGVLAPVLEDSDDVEAIALTNSDYWLDDVSHTFHGRDSFAPVAAHLVRGVPLEALGMRIRDPVRLTLPTPRVTERGAEGTVLWVDRFGNLVTNIPADALAPGEAYRVTVGRLTVTGLFTTYGQVRAGQPLALVGSHGYVEIAVREGSAAELAGVDRGAVVRVQAES